LSLHRSGTGLGVKFGLTSPRNPGDDYVSNRRDRPCPICGRFKNCRIAKDGSKVWCGKVDYGPTFTGETNDGNQFKHVLKPGYQRPILDPPPRREMVVSKSFLAVADQCQNHPEVTGRLRGLAEQLGVPVKTLEELGVGWSSDGWWSFPERDATGRVIGINRRFPDGSKRAVASSKRGLYLSPVWSDRPGPLLLVEGGSDTAALLGAGLAAVGLPSAGGGRDHVVRLLESVPEDRAVVIVGEDDRLKNGEPRKLPPEHRPDCPGCRVCWPGKAAALTLGGQLTQLTGRVVSVVLPPAGAKDSRAWVQSAVPGPDLGDRFLRDLVAVKTFNPPPVFLPESAGDGEVRELGDWRAEMVERRRSATVAPDRPVAFLDRSPTGSGKTHADVAAIAERGSGLVLVPTHGNGVEVLESFRSAGVEAVAYPKRRTKADEVGPVTCWNRVADLVEEVGLSVLSVVCPGCPFADQCREKNGGGYLSQLVTAAESPVVVATHCRGAATGLPELVAGRKYVAVHEDPHGLLRPTVKGELVEMQLAAEGLNWALTRDPKILGGDDNKGVEENVYDALVSLCQTAEYLAEQLKTAEVSGPVTVPSTAEISGGVWRAILATMMRGSKSGGISRLPGKGIWRVLVAAVNRSDPARVSVVVECLPDGQVKRKILAVRSRSLPSGVPVWFGDATTTQEELQGLLPGVEVIDQTPTGRLPRVQTAVQIPKDLTMRAGESAKKTGSGRSPVRSLVAGVLADRPEAVRVGIITHRDHVAELEAMREEGADGGRIARVGYFWHGSERSDNSWSRECDLVLVLGTPRPGGDAVRTELVAAGDYDAARIKNPVWGPLVWEGLGQDGETVRVAGRGYLDPRWQRAFRRLVRSLLVQSIGRGRTILDCGVPVVVLSVEECGLVISDRGGEGVGLSAGCQRVLRVLTELSGKECDTTATGNYVGVLSHFDAGEIAKRAGGMTARTVQRYLSALEERGLVIRRGGGRGTRWSVVGESAPPPAAPVAEASPPVLAAVVTPPDDIPQEPQVSGNCCWWDRPTPPREDWVVWLEGVEAEEEAKRAAIKPAAGGGGLVKSTSSHAEPRRGSATYSGPPRIPVSQGGIGGRSELAVAGGGLVHANPGDGWRYSPSRGGGAVCSDPHSRRND